MYHRHVVCTMNRKWNRNKKKKKNNNNNLKTRLVIQTATSDDGKCERKVRFSARGLQISTTSSTMQQVPNATNGKPQDQEENLFQKPRIPYPDTNASITKNQVKNDVSKIKNESFVQKTYITYSIDNAGLPQCVDQFPVPMQSTWKSCLTQPINSAVPMQSAQKSCLTQSINSAMPMQSAQKSCLTYSINSAVPMQSAQKSCFTHSINSASISDSHNQFFVPENKTRSSFLPHPVTNANVPICSKISGISHNEYRPALVQKSNTSGPLLNSYAAYAKSLPKQQVQSTRPIMGRPSRFAPSVCSTYPQMSTFLPLNEVNPNVVQNRSFIDPAGLSNKEQFLHFSKLTQKDSSLMHYTSDTTKQLNEYLRPIVIDGSNVAFSHGMETYFSCKGIKLCIDFFLQRGHTVVKAFVPQYRRKKACGITDRHILEELSRGKQYVVFTPSRAIGSRLVSCYDDRFVIDYAIETNGVIVSNDNYRDLMEESDLYRHVVENRLLMFTFVDDLFMLPKDPLGKNGPTLDDFLLMPE